MRSRPLEPANGCAAADVSRRIDAAGLQGRPADGSGYVSYRKQRKREPPVSPEVWADVRSWPCEVESAVGSSGSSTEGQVGAAGG